MATPLVRLPELSELAAFVVAVDEGSLAAAARRLRLTGPAVAKRVRRLETLAGTPLLERSERGVRPTPEGRAFLEPATRLLEDARSLVAPTDGSRHIAGVRALLGTTVRPEQLLHDTEVLFAELFHTNPDPIVITTMNEGHVVEANQAYCRLLGHPREELRGRTTVEMGIWADPKDRADALARIRGGGGTVAGDTTLRTRDGRTLEVTYVVDTVDVREEELLLVRLADVTRRRSLERYRRKHERRAELVNDLAQLAVAGVGVEAVVERALAIAAAELEGDAALVELSDPPALVSASRRLPAARRRLLAGAAARPGHAPGPLVTGGAAYLVRRVPAEDAPPLALVVAAERDGLADPEAPQLLEILASQLGLAVGWQRAAETMARLLENAPGAIAATDDAGTVFAATPAARTLAPGLAAGRPLLDALDAGDEPQPLAWRRLLDGGALETGAVRLELAHGIVPGRRLVVLRPVAVPA